jgi:hypothetical protein
MKTVLLALLVLTMTGAAFAQRVDLVRNGRSRYSILLAPDASPAMQHGAEELKRYLKEMSGADLPILSPKAGALGLPRYVVRIETDPKLAEEELSVRTEGTTLRISGGGKRGALYSCYAFLEEVLGCRWYNARISRIPARRTITLGPLDLHEKPDFEYREPYYTEALDRDWAVRNRTNGNFQHLDASVGGRVAYGEFVHTFNSLVPPEQYFDTHPEYFSMVNGKRMKGYYQLCLTNPDVLRLTIEKVQQWIAANPNATIFSVSQNDTYGRCECPACKAVEQEEGAPSGVVLRFVNAVADAIAKDHPNILIDTLAYQWSEDPPRLVRPRPNVRIRLAPIGACFSHPLDACDANKHAFENLQAWGKITDQLYIWHYSTNFANYLQPLPDLDEIAGDIPLFKKHGAVGIFYEGDYAPGGGGEMSELKAYLMAKLLWDTHCDPKPIIAEYVTAVYGKGAPYIAQWLDLIHKGARTNNVHARIYDPPTAPYLAPDVQTEGVRLFDAAEKATADDASALAEVRRARLALEYVQLMTAKPDAPERAELARTVAAKIHEYGIGQIREGEDVAAFLKRIGQ